MKKTILGVLAIACAFSSCTKNQNAINTKSTSVSHPTISKKTNSYYSAILSPTSDPNVFTGSYDGVNFSASGLTYDKIAYPNNVNGVPAMGILSVPTGTATITQTYVQDGSSYIVFTQPNPAFNLDSLNLDLGNFDTAFSNWIAEGAPEGDAPLITNYVKNTYVNGNNPITTTICKLIKVAAGSQSYYAIADPGYPQPSPVTNGTPPPSTQSCDVILNGVTYDLWLSIGASGTITGIADAYNSSGQISTTGWEVSGTFSNYNTKTQTVTVNLTIYEPGINNTVTYSGTAYTGF